MRASESSQVEKDASAAVGDNDIVHVWIADFAMACATREQISTSISSNGGGR